MTKITDIEKLLAGPLKSALERYAERYGLHPFVIRMDGRNPAFKRGDLTNLPVVIRARAYAIQEGIRWGESCVTFLMPNVVFWVVPLENCGRFEGAMVGGEVLADRDPYSRIETVNHLAANGCPREAALQYVDSLPVWDSQERTREAAESLFALFYQISGWNPEQLRRNHTRQVQQRQIAEEIHQMKKGLHAAAPLEEERRLLSLMKAGDLRAARGELNKALGGFFAQTANLSLVRAQLIEMMGYLVRAAVEDNPAMGPMIQSNQRWMTRIIEANDFEELSRAVQEALDDFMGKMALHGHTRAGENVTRMLAWLGDHYHEPVTLNALATAVGLSSFRVAHILKESTGKTMLQHVNRLRIQEAQRLLERSDLSCADVAYETGFSDQSYFIKQFRRWMGISPAKYRRMYLNRAKS